MRKSQQKNVCFSRLMKCLKASMANSVDLEQTAPKWQTVWTQIRLLIGAVCSGSTLFASILNLSVMFKC